MISVFPGYYKALYFYRRENNCRYVSVTNNYKSVHLRSKNETNKIFVNLLKHFTFCNFVKIYY